MKGMNIESFRCAQCAMLDGWRNSNPSLRYTTYLNEAHTFSFTFLCSCVDVCPRFSLFLRLLYWNFAQPYKHSVARSSSSNMENIYKKKTSLPSLNTILWEERFWYGCHQKVCPSFNFTGKPYPGVCGVVFFPPPSQPSSFLSMSGFPWAFSSRGACAWATTRKMPVVYYCRDA